MQKSLREYPVPQCLHLLRTKYIQVEENANICIQTMRKGVARPCLGYLEQVDFPEWNLRCRGLF